MGLSRSDGGKVSGQGWGKLGAEAPYSVPSSSASPTSEENRTHQLYPVCFDVAFLRREVPPPDLPKGPVPFAFGH